MNKMQASSFAMATLIVAGGSMATAEMHGKQGKAKDGSTVKNVMVVDDVETIMDEVSAYTGKTLRVKGEIADKVGPQAFVLESGGIFDNEITVVFDKNAKGAKELAGWREGAEVLVTGKIRSAGVVDIRRDYGWDLDPQIEAEWEGTRPYLVATEVTLVQRD